MWFSCSIIRLLVNDMPVKVPIKFNDKYIDKLSFTTLLYLSLIF